MGIHRIAHGRKRVVVEVEGRRPRTAAIRGRELVRSGSVRSRGNGADGVLSAEAERALDESLVVGHRLNDLGCVGLGRRLTGPKEPGTEANVGAFDVLA